MTLITDRQLIDTSPRDPSTWRAAELNADGRPQERLCADLWIGGSDALQPDGLDPLGDDYRFVGIVSNLFDSDQPFVTVDGVPDAIADWSAPHRPTGSSLRRLAGRLLTGPFTAPTTTRHCVVVVHCDDARGGVIRCVAPRADVGTLSVHAYGAGGDIDFSALPAADGSVIGWHYRLPAAA